MQRLLTPWARRGGDVVNDFVNAFKFMGDNTCLLLDKTLEHLEL